MIHCLRNCVTIAGVSGRSIRSFQEYPLSLSRQVGCCERPITPGSHGQSAGSIKSASASPCNRFPIGAGRRR